MFGQVYLVLFSRRISKKSRTEQYPEEIFISCGLNIKAIKWTHIAFPDEKTNQIKRI